MKAEFLHCSRIGGFFILVDLLSGCGVGVGEVGTRFVIGVGSGESWAGFVAGVRVMGKLEGYKVGGGGVLASVSVLVGVIRDVVSFLGVWGV